MDIKIVAWLAFSFAVGFLWKKLKLSFVSGVIWSLVLSPFIGALIAFVSVFVRNRKDANKANTDIQS